jgi:hypothetical protein
MRRSSLAPSFRLLFVVTLCAGVSCESTDVDAPLDRPCLRYPAAISQSIDLGSIKQGQTKSFKILCVNDENDPIEIARYRSSCECVRLESLPLAIAPGGQEQVSVTVDLRDERDFSGELGVSLTCFGHEGDKLFMGALSFQVIPADESTEESRDTLGSELD